MTQEINKPYKAMDNDEALQILYGEGIRNLTAEGYTEAMRQLRSKDSSMAGRVQRMLPSVAGEKGLSKKAERVVRHLKGSSRSVGFSSGQSASGS